MRDYHQDGFDIGYDGTFSGDRDYPTTDGENYDFVQGVEDGRNRRRIADELDSSE